MRYENLAKNEIEKIEELSKSVEKNLRKILTILNENYLTCCIIDGDFNMNNAVESKKRISIWRKNGGEK